MIYSYALFLLEAPNQVVKIYRTASTTYLLVRITNDNMVCNYFLCQNSPISQWRIADYLYQPIHLELN